MSHAFYTDAANKADYRKRVWYQTNLMGVLAAAKECQAREIDASIELAQKLMRLLDEKVAPPIVVPPRNAPQYEDANLMKPIQQETLDILFKSTEKGSTEKYLKERNKLSPEDKFYFRVLTSMDYGWQQKASKQRARDVNRGRCAILRHTFYRKNNLAPDPKHYASPASREFSICSEYSCNFN